MDLIERNLSSQMTYLSPKRVVLAASLRDLRLITIYDGL